MKAREYFAILCILTFLVSTGVLVPTSYATVQSTYSEMDWTAIHNNAYSYIQYKVTTTPGPPVYITLYIARGFRDVALVFKIYDSDAWFSDGVNHYIHGIAIYHLEWVYNYDNETGKSWWSFRVHLVAYYYNSTTVYEVRANVVREYNTTSQYAIVRVLDVDFNNGWNLGLNFEIQFSDFKTVTGYMYSQVDWKYTYADSRIFEIHFYHEGENSYFVVERFEVPNEILLDPPFIENFTSYKFTSGFGFYNPGEIKYPGIPEGLVITYGSITNTSNWVKYWTNWGINIAWAIIALLIPIVIVGRIVLRAFNLIS